MELANLSPTNDYNGTTPDKKSGSSPQYEKLRLEKQEEVSVYEKLQDASEAKPADSEYQELKTQDIAQPNSYDTINHGSMHPTSDNVKQGEKTNSEYECITMGEGGAKASTDPNYQQLQMKGIAKPSVYETIGTVKINENTKEVQSEEVLPIQSNSTTDTEQVFNEECSPFQRNGVSNEGVDTDGITSDLKEVTITCTANISLENDGLESNSQSESIKTHAV